MENLKIGDRVAVKPGCSKAWPMDGQANPHAPDGTVGLITDLLGPDHGYPGQFRVDLIGIGERILGPKWLAKQDGTGEPSAPKPALLVLGTRDELVAVLGRLENYGLVWASGCRPTVLSLDAAARGLAVGLDYPGKIQQMLGLTGTATLAPPGGLRIAHASSLVDSTLDELFGPPKRHDKITRKWLLDRGACRKGLAWFIETFGERAEVDRAALRNALPELSWKVWLDQR